MESLDLNFWKGKNVLISGHTGFKGSWLALMLTLKGAKVTGYSLPAPTNPSMFELCDLEHKTHKHIIGDVNNLTTLKKAVEGQDVVFHLAAQALVLESYRSPTHTYQTNVMGTANILEACRDNEIKSIVCITSDKCYKNKEWHWGYRENDDLGGIDPYSASKACAEMVIESYRNSFNMPVASARAGNVIGGGDWGNYRLIPNIIRTLTDNKPLIIRKPKATRPWQHVLDPLAGYINLAENLYNDDSFAEAWNFAPNSVVDVSVEEIVEKMKSFFDFDYEIKVSQNDPHEARNLKLDCFKALNLLNWRCKLDVNTSLEYINDWYKCYFDNEGSKDRLYIKSVFQIEKYLKEV